MCKTFGFSPDAFAEMEWHVFLAWLETKARMEEAARPSPHSWAVPDAWFAETREKARREERGY